MVIQGYVLDTLDLAEIDGKIRDIRRKIKKEADRLYARLLGREIAFLCDKVSQNILTKDPNIPIYDSALDNLQKMISTAESNGLANDYNFSIFSHVIPFEGKTYLRVISQNKSLLKAFKGLEEYSLDEREADDIKNAKTQTWNKIMGLFKNNEPPVVALSPELGCKPEDVIYPSLCERAEEVARENILSAYVNMVSGGRQIPPFLTVRYFNMALELLLTESGQQELRTRKMTLMTQLIDLQKDDKAVFIKGTDIAVAEADKIDAEEKK